MISCRAWRRPRPSQRPRATPTLQIFQLGSVLKRFEVFQWEVFLIFYWPLECYAYRGVKADFLEMQRNLTLLGIGMPSFIVLLHQPPCPAKNYDDISQLIVFT